MSGFVSEPERSHEQQVASFHSQHAKPTRLRDGKMSDVSPEESPVITNLQDDYNPETEISAGQKMLSAVSGSLLTSLLGEKSTAPC